MNVELREVSPQDVNVMSVFHRWAEAEPDREWYTCRPVSLIKPLDEYIVTLQSHMEKRTQRLFTLLSDGDAPIPIGKVEAFDFNPRNRSAEFGYYLPEEQRGKGFGTTMMGLFLDLMFRDGEWNLYKLYATTASGNLASMKLLRRFDFHLDGTIREHYWIRGGIQDQLHFSLFKREWTQQRGDANGI